MARTGSKLTNLSDLELVAMASSGEQTAFLVLYDRYKTGVSLHVGGFISLREEVEDVVLESFQKAFSQLETYNPDYKFSTWLYRIARNTAFDHIEKSGRVNSNMPTHSIDDEDSGVNDIATNAGNPEIAVISNQEYEKVVSAIAGLPETYRKVAQMVLMDNYGYQEVSQELNIPLNTVRTRVKRGREMLFKLLEAEDEND